MRKNIPLTDQLMQEMVTAISAGEMGEDDGRLPSESELSAQYGVSRATVRDVLARLQSAGVVVRRQGVGTFISEPLRAEPGMIWGWLDQAPAFVDLISQSGYRAQCDLLSTGSRPAGEIAGHLDTSPDEYLITIEKLFSADGEPLIYSWTALPESLIRNCSETESPSPEEYRQSIYWLLQNYCDHDVDFQTSGIHAVEADGLVAEQLRCAQGAPLLRVAEIGYAASGVALFYAVHHFRGDRVSFRQIRIPTFRIDPL